ncbi:MAG: cupin domain-containing protein [Ferruginibacter sp.]
MTKEKFLVSGLIETYCLGFTSAAENILVENMVTLYPEVKNELETVKFAMNTYIKGRELQPSPQLKMKLMTNIYSQEAEVKKEFIPLLNRITDPSLLLQTALANHLEFPAEDFENLYMQPLPSTREVTNFAVWVKQGHEPEMHDDMTEYIAVMEGSCNMYFGNEKKSYKKGDIITIPPYLLHHAEITSSIPMFALVQRQML